MPAFTFEKISPPDRGGSSATTPEKPRSVISQVIDRFAEKRVKRGSREERGKLGGDDKPTE